MEPTNFPLGRWNLYIGGAGRVVDGYINLDLFRFSGVDVQADAEQLPLLADQFTRIIFLTSKSALEPPTAISYSPGSTAKAFLVSS